MTNIDMHFHSTNSDWKNTYNELIEEAKRKEIQLACITDHDFISNPDAFIEAWIKSYYSTEISARDKKNNHSLHITWYSKVFNERLNKVLENTREKKLEIVKKQIEVLQNLWIEISIEDMVSLAKVMNRDISSINKFDIAYILFSRKNNRELIEKLSWENFKNTEDFFISCLKPSWKYFHIFWLAYWTVEEYEPSLELCSEIAKENDDILSIAHPNFSFANRWWMDYLEENLDYFLWLWINAIEINNKANKEWVNYILEIRKRFWIIITLWSDCHFIWQNDSKHASLWELNPFLDEELIVDIKEKIEEKLDN